MANRTAAIAGGGIGGLACALALAREGFHVDVFEQRTGQATAGAGIQLGPNATRVLKRLGVLADLRPLAVAPNGIDIFDAQRGGTLTSLPLGDSAITTFGSPYLTVHRQALFNVLRQACGELPEIVFHHGTRVARVAGPPALRFQTNDDDDVTADLLVGADGVRSVVAQAGAFGGRTGPTDNSRQTVALRALIPRASLLDVYSFTRIGLWLGPHVHVVHYPVDAGSALNVVVITDQLQRHVDADETSLQDLWRAAVSQADVRDALAGTVPVLAELATIQDVWSGWIVHEDAAPARMVTGHCALVGDAAHPILPYQAQGAAMALEDAEALALCVGDPAGRIEQGLAVYEDLRLRRTQRVAAASRRNKGVYNLSGAMGIARNAVLKIAPGTTLMNQFAWLYSYDVLDEIEV